MVSLNATLNARADVDFVSASYVFAPPVLGGQLAIGMTGMAGYNSTSIDGTLTASIGGLTATRTGSISDERGGFGDPSNGVAAVELRRQQLYALHDGRRSGRNL